MPRNRTVRVAVLGSSVQRAAASGFASTRSSALRRRIVVGFLVLLSLVLITLSFRSSVLDPVQGFGVSVLRPFEVAANRVARPFRDSVSWTQGLFHAKAENRRLARDNAMLRQEVSQFDAMQQQNTFLRAQLRYVDSPSFPQCCTEVAASVISNPLSPFDQTITISAGSSSGIVDQDVVVTANGLVGQVVRVSASVSQVMLITDPDSSVRAVDASQHRAVGILDHGSASGSLVLDGITKDKKVEEGDLIITAGSPTGKGELPSLYPRNIAIGRVTSVGQNDIDIYKEIQVQPYVDLASLETVLVLIPKPVAATQTSKGTAKAKQ
ncbi:MAG TPA: rod shape-determining protein MreC [Gaiellaceae bacterium]|nr:rod shape-determining protein MreC [Gaiellaceae bacterium]